MMPGAAEIIEVGTRTATTRAKARLQFQLTNNIGQSCFEEGSSAAPDFMRSDPSSSLPTASLGLAYGSVHALDAHVRLEPAYSTIHVHLARAGSQNGAVRAVNNGQNHIANAALGIGHCGAISAWHAGCIIPAMPTPISSPLRVLIIDNEPVRRAVLAQSLQVNGYQVLEHAAITLICWTACRNCQWR